MKKMSINEAAEHFGISKEAIHNRIRRGSLEALLENGVKMVLIDEAKSSSTKRPAPQRAKTSVNSERYYKLLEEQNAKLESRVEHLEDETRALRDQKELMLIQEREKIEQIYKEKDEQLKNILATLSSQFMLNTSMQAKPAEIEEALEVEIEPQELPQELAKEKPISLKKYLKKMEFSEKRVAKIVAKFEKIAQNDARFIKVGSKYYLDPQQYDYSDLLKK